MKGSKGDGCKQACILKNHITRIAKGVSLTTGHNNMPGENDEEMEWRDEGK